ncbi:MAG: hypothetical protein R2780_03800 [Crocinitomicaceae bacterium]|nr:hypothetical protein [Crocinitomicaceae bacterium]
MEKINLNNYEAFFLDYLEGNLSAQQEFELLDFLEKHPDLKAELDMDLDEVKLDPVSISMGAASLKKKGIQPEEVDGLMIASVEGLLSSTEEMALSTYVVANGLESEIKYYHNTVLHADLTEVYGDKKDLKKRNRIAPILFPVIGAAAIAITVWISNSENEDKTTISNNSIDNQVAMEIEPKFFSHQMEDKHFDAVEHNTRSVHEITQQTGYVVTDKIVKDPKNVKEVIEGSTPLQAETIKTIIPGESNIKDEKLDQKSDQKLDDKDLKKTEEKILDRPSYEEKKNNKNKGGIITEEPIKPLTDVAGNLFNKDISYQRNKNTSSNEYVSHHVKIGNFEFQRKKD